MVYIRYSYYRENRRWVGLVNGPSNDDVTRAPQIRDVRVVWI